MLKQITYFSKATTLMNFSSLATLLQQSRRRNLACGVTGMLLYFEANSNKSKQGRFIQVIEGPEAEVDAIYQSIQGDQRHKYITTLNERIVDKRDFSDWVLGFEFLTRRDIKNNDGLFLLDEDFSKYRNHEYLNIPLNYLKNFYSLRQF